MRILLLHPNYHSGGAEIAGNWPPAWAAYVSGALKGAGFADVRVKADSPMLLRRLVEGLASLPERRHLDEITAFLEAHPIEGAKQATAQTLERMRMDVALRERLVPAVAAWLKARR